MREQKHKVGQESAASSSAISRQSAVLKPQSPTDSRQSYVTQMKLHQLAAQSGSVARLSTFQRQLADAHGSEPTQLSAKPASGAATNTQSAAIQMASIVRNSGQSFSWGQNNQNSTIVGRVMEAYLDPDDKLRGESANLNEDQTPMMQWIKSHHGIKAHDAVKGHLLNDNVGGKALNVNLFPITKAANAVHLRTAENYVKNKLWDDQQGVYYKVVANTGNPCNFEYEIQDWNPSTDKKSGSKYAGTIVSDLGSPKDMDIANEDEVDYERALLTNANAVKKGRAYAPANRVGDLPSGWSGLRAKSGQITKLQYGSNSAKYEE